jgi:precorrin-6A/cobalt-precorrin-6A reductase
MGTHVLVLGGTGEARALAGRLAARMRVTLSLAGRTRAPALPDCAVRVGGFGGADGLAAWLRGAGVTVLVDATHPFARVISANARAAAEGAGVPLVVLARPPWAQAPGDRWTEVPDMADAAAALGPVPRRVFLAIGRQEVAAFRAAPHHRYLVRSVEPVAPGDLPQHAETILARGPFPEADEARLLRQRGIEVVVAKNSGGAATYGKIAAARALGVPVVMVARAAVPGAVATVEAAEARVRHLAGLPAERGV